MAEIIPPLSRQARSRMTAEEKRRAVFRPVRAAGVRRCIIGIMFACVPLGASAQNVLLEAARNGDYSAAGLYDPQIIEYDNGMTLILRHRPGIRTVSIRVRIGLGLAHYECGQRHVPHFLEHMLYDSIPGVTEAELEQRFFELGATSNAATRSTETIFKLDTFSGTAIQGLDLTADMLTGAELNRRSFHKAKKVIFREQGGDPGPVEMQSLVGGPLASGAREALADVSPRHLGMCGIWDTGQDVDYASVEDAYRNHYTPENMTWVIVGELDERQVLDWAGRRLASLPKISNRAPFEPRRGDFSSRNYAGFASEPRVTLLAFTDGLTGEDYFAHTLIEHLLDTRLYERLRLEAALTYTPAVDLYSESDWGLFAIQADAEKGEQEEAIHIINELVAELVDAPLPTEDFRTAQLSLLRSWAQSVETNAGYANYYINSHPTFRRDGRFLNDELQVARLEPEDLQRAARRLFEPRNVVTVRDADRQVEIEAK